MKCEEVREKLSAFIDDELPLDEKAGVESHLKACSACLHEAEELRALGSALRGMPRMKAPPSVAQAVAAHIAAGRMVKIAPFRRSTRRLEWVISAAALILIAINITFLATMKPDELGREDGSLEIVPAKTDRSAEKSVATKAIPKSADGYAEKHAQPKPAAPIPASKSDGNLATGRAKESEQRLEVAKGDSGERELLKGYKAKGQDDSKEKWNEAPPPQTVAPAKPVELQANRPVENMPLKEDLGVRTDPTAVTFTLVSADLPATATAVSGVIEKLNLVADGRARKDTDSSPRAGKMMDKEKSQFQSVAPSEIVLQCTDDQLAVLTSDISKLSSGGGFAYSLSGAKPDRDEALGGALKKQELAEENADKVQAKQEDSDRGGEKRFAKGNIAKPSAEPQAAAPGAQGEGGRVPSLDRENKEEEKAGIYKQKSFGAGGGGGGEAEGKKASPLRTVIIRLIDAKGAKPAVAPEK